MVEVAEEEGEEDERGQQDKDRTAKNGTCGKRRGEGEMREEGRDAST